jgi:uncharacterized membrane protein YidH (DUF202 family)
MRTILLPTVVATTTIDLTSLPQPTADNNTINTILSILFVTLGAISVLVIALAGFRYVISNGDPRAVQQSKNAILYAIVGLVISVAAFSIVNFVLGNL